jgi:hypothetical protein
MACFKKISMSFALSSALACLLCSQPATAQEFKIDSQVYSSAQSTPVSSSLTIFDDTMVYDIAFDPTNSTTIIEIVVFDVSNKTFELIDLHQNRRVHLQQFEIVRMLENQRQQGMQDERLRSLVLPEMKEDYDAAGGTLVVANANIRYEARCRKINDQVIQPRYFEFLEQYTRLAVSDPRRMPPFSRMQLNESLKKYGLFPEEIKLTMNGGDLHDGDLQLRSSHTMIDRLSESDRSRVQQIRAAWAKVPQVTLAEYRGIERVAEGDSQTDKVRR